MHSETQLTTEGRGYLIQLTYRLSEEFAADLSEKYRTILTFDASMPRPYVWREMFPHFLDWLADVRLMDVKNISDDDEETLLAMLEGLADQFADYLSPEAFSEFEYQTDVDVWNGVVAMFIDWMRELETEEKEV